MDEKKDSVNAEDIRVAEESLSGYLLEKDLQERKIEAFKKKRDIIVGNPRKLKPDYAYEEIDGYWEAQAELHIIDFEEAIYKAKKMLTTVNETIPEIEKRLDRLKGDDNE